jgi:hypothetical protein
MDVEQIINGGRDTVVLLLTGPSRIIVSLKWPEVPTVTCQL